MKSESISETEELKSKSLEEMNISLRVALTAITAALKEKGLQIIF